MSWFTQPWGLLGLLALPAVVALHLFRHRFRDYPVAALFLWEDAQRSETTGRTRQPLRRTPSFWLECAAALLAGLLLAGFDPLAGAEAKHLVVVLDDSASMAHAPRREAARAALEERFTRHGRRTRVTIVRSGVRPQLLCGPATVLPDARRALDAWIPRAPQHDLVPALGFARELAGDGELLLITDQPLAEDLAPGPRVRVLCVGTPADNLALAEVRRSRVDGAESISVRVRSYADAPRVATVRILSGEQELARRELSLAADGEASLRVPLPADAPTLRVQLEDDALAIDNTATLHPAVDRRVRVGLALDQGTAAALRAHELLDALPGVIRTSALAEADLVLAHELAAAPAWTLVLPRPVAAAEEAEAFVRGFLAERSHPLLQDLTLDGLVWTRRKDFSLPGAPLISAADQALLTESGQDGAVAFYLNLLAQRSTVARSPDWPILAANLVAWRRDALPGPRELNLIAGEAFVLRHPGRQRYTLRDGGAPRELFAEDLLQIEDLPARGDYQLEAEDGGSWQFAVNFRDGRESDLRQASFAETPPHSGETELAADRYADSPAARILLLLLLGCVAADWWVLRRGGRG